MVTLLPTKQDVRAAARDEGVCAKAGMDASKVTRHTVALNAPKPISLFSEANIIDSAPAVPSTCKLTPWSVGYAVRFTLHASPLNLPTSDPTKVLPDQPAQAIAFVRPALSQRHRQRSPGISAWN